MDNFIALQQYHTWAIIGMNNDPDKFAYKIFFKLLENNKEVYGINGKYKEIEGHPIYPDFASLPKEVEVAVFVVNPTIGITYLEDCKAKGVRLLWLQPGTISDELLDKAKSMDFEIIENCVLASYILMPKK